MVLIRETKADLFSSEFFNTSHVAHCVARDLIMGRGIAVEFKRRFGVPDSLRHSAKMEHVGVLDRTNGTKILYLFTKNRSNELPKLRNIETSLRAMARLLKGEETSKGVVHLSVPRLACGLDRQNWLVIKDLLNKVFEEEIEKQDSNIKVLIDVYYI